MTSSWVDLLFCSVSNHVAINDASSAHLELTASRPCAHCYQVRCGVFRVSILGIVLEVLGRYLIVGLGPAGQQSYLLHA